MKGISATAVLMALLTGMTLAAKVAAFHGVELGHSCLNPSNNPARINQRNACQTFADSNGYRVGVLRPCDRDDVLCGEVSVCVEPEINYVCIGYSPEEGNCTTNQECSEGYFCSKKPGYCNGRGVCEEIPADGGCPAIYDPVCGCDNNIYGNSCEASKAGVSIQSTGECQ